MHRQVEFTRQDLLNKVWAQPVLKVAREIGVSDVALAKACRKASIPLPARGHWAIPENRRPKQPTLPSVPAEHPGRVVFSVLDPEHRPVVVRPMTLQPRIPVPDQLESPHRLVTVTLKALKRAKPTDGRIHVSGASALDVSISPGQADRAVRILDTLIKACEPLGMRWSTGQEGTRIRCDGEHIQVRLHETLSKQPVEPPPRKTGTRQLDYGGLWYPKYEWVSKGRLSFLVEDYVANGARRAWAGSTTTPLEAKLHEIVVGLPLIAAGIGQKREEREAWQHQWEREQARRKEAARQAEIQRRLRQTRAVTEPMGAVIPPARLLRCRGGRNCSAGTREAAGGRGMVGLGAPASRRAEPARRPSNGYLRSPGDTRRLVLQRASKARGGLVDVLVAARSRWRSGQNLVIGANRTVRKCVSQERSYRTSSFLSPLPFRALIFTTREISAHRHYAAAIRSPEAEAR